MAGAEARHLRGLTLVDYPEKDREPPTLLAALERDGAMAPAEFSLQCANFAKRSYQSRIGTLAAILLIESSAPALTGLQRSPERLVPDSTYFCAPMGIDPMLEHDGHESIQRPGLSSDIQRAIGQRLRQHYVIERSLPARLADLLKEFEQRSNEPETVARGHYVNAA
jgi:hypothetical protein